MRTGTSRTIAVFTARLSPPSRRHTTEPPRCIKDRGRAAREEEYGRARGRGTGTRDYWAPEPRITGITPRIRNRARGRQSATVFAVPVPPLRAPRHSSSLSTPSGLASPLPAAPHSRVSTRNHGASRRFSSRSRGNLQITIMEEHLSKKRSARDATREPRAQEEPPDLPWRRGVTVPPLLRRRLAFADR